MIASTCTTHTHTHTQPFNEGKRRTKRRFEEAHNEGKRSASEGLKIRILRTSRKSDDEFVPLPQH